MATKKNNGWKRVATNIYQRGSSFEVRVRMGPGEREVRSAQSKEQAIEVRNHLQNRRRRGKKGESQVTVKEWAEKWLGAGVDSRGRPWRDTTLAYYRSQTRPFVKQFGDRKLASFTRGEAQEWALENPSRARAASALFGAAFNRVLIDQNPFEKVQTYRTRSKRDLMVLTREEVEGKPHGLLAVAEAVHDSFGAQYAALVAMAAWTGMRPGELFALRWGDIDFRGGWVHVVQAKQARGGKLVAPKGGEARKIVLPPNVAVRLRADVPKVDGSDLVFHTRNEAPFSQRTNHYYWDPVRRAFWAKLPKDRQAVVKPDFDFYELRHFCAKQMLRPREQGGMGAPAYVVAAQLGHKDGGTLVQELYGRQAHEDALEVVQQGYREMFG